MQKPAYAAYLDIVCCPSCKGPVRDTGQALECLAPACARAFPIVGGRPILIDEDRSIFFVDSYRSAGALAKEPEDGARNGLRAWARRLPSPSINLSAVRCFEQMKQRLLANSGSPVVLVVGGGIMGKGMRVLTATPQIRMINIDPSPTSDAVMFCDGHDLPFGDGTIDAVITQAVLEHVADPVRCAAEIARVLKPQGLLYSEIPFMQQVHMHGYDFTRFTHLGHRKLFNQFAEIESGAVAGPGTALSWSWRYFLAAMTSWRPAQKLLFWIGRVTGMLLEQTDYLFRQCPGGLDAASCIYFFGEKSTRAASDRELVKAYRGAQR